MTYKKVKDQNSLRKQESSLLSHASSMHQSVLDDP